MLLEPRRPELAQQSDARTGAEGQVQTQPGTSAAHTVASPLSLVAGVLITVGAVLGGSLGFMGVPYGYGGFAGWMGGYGGMMGGLLGGYDYGGYGAMGPGMMRGFYGGYGSYGNYSYTPAIFGLTAVGLAAGIVVLAAALYMRGRPVGEVRTLGAIVLVFSIIGLVTVGGVFLLGGVLGIVGGMIALVAPSDSVSRR